MKALLPHNIYGLYNFSLNIIMPFSVLFRPVMGSMNIMHFVVSQAYNKKKALEEALRDKEEEKAALQRMEDEEINEISLEDIKL